MSQSQPAPSPPLPSSLVPTITPASLSSLAIYNPTLGPTDETLPQQLVFYTSRLGNAAVSENEKLRQIGLAQGITEFSRGFSTSPSNSTSVETQRSRIVTLELEEGGWWVHAQVDLTYIHNPTVQPPTQEFSSREVATPQLLLAQLKKAYTQFRFHYGTFAMNWERLDRAAFCRRLEKYWLRWAWVRWDVMLHGNPVIDILAEKAIRMAGGRLGKEIGLQERVFMEGWIKKEKTHGLVDMVVSRFGGEDKEEEEGGKDDSGTTASKRSSLWFWSSQQGGTASTTKDTTKKHAQDQPPPVLIPSDGCVFKGIGALEVNDVANYLSELYEKGDDTYVVTSNGVRRKRRRKQRPNGTPRLGISSGESSPRRSTSTVRHARTESDGPRRTGSNLGREPEVQDSAPQPGDPPQETTPAQASSSSPPEGDTTAKYRNLINANSKILNLLTFGLSSRVQSMHLRGSSISSEAGIAAAAESPEDSNNNNIENDPAEAEPSNKLQRGSFLIGFQGDLDIEDIDDDHEDSSGRITTRTVYLPRASSTALEELRLAVYTNKPFLFAFLFTPTSRSLSSPSFYRSLHHQLSPIVRSLLSKSPTPPKTSLKPPFDLFLNGGCVYTTLPAIPEPGRELPGWTRAEALHVYTIILGMMQQKGDRERSARSMRGWWINWLKLDAGRGEGMVVRRAGEGKGDVDGVPQGDVKKFLEGLAEGKGG
ncbi:hypothetical protein FN846DRAFT_911707 [Sphaerosporella brunnea]|uniref:CCZ1/INTU/HSP4 first Longin domain-containing protein n=1 Tax=Sphaerosporella brunnea TaxID=1250544 RepID=A0A5J5EJV8_9PEZI|nr:hypothetical protein FN846DRAFT_911707 [Sphaerosporella brunnea]